MAPMGTISAIKSHNNTYKYKVSVALQFVASPSITISKLTQFGGTTTFARKIMALPGEIPPVTLL